MKDEVDGGWIIYMLEHTKMRGDLELRFTNPPADDSPYQVLIPSLPLEVIPSSLKKSKEVGRVIHKVYVLES